MPHEYRRPIYLRTLADDNPVFDPDTATPDATPATPATPSNTAPAMPAVSKDATWNLRWSQDFNLTAAETKILNVYGAAATSNDIGKGQFAAYTYSTTFRGGFTDTRHNSFKTITMTTTLGSPVVTSAGLFTNANYCYIGSYPALAGVFPTETQIISVANTSSMTVDANALQTGTFSVVVYADFGYYDQNSYSVAAGSSTCRLRVYTDANGRHHVGALVPRLDPTTSTNVLGGRFSICMRAQQVIPTYKVAHLMWPQNQRNPTYNGEIDLPECDLNLTDTVFTFMHWQDVNSQNSGNAHMNICDGNWHIFVNEWRPNPTTPASSTYKAYATTHGNNAAITAGSLVTPFLSVTGVNVPRTVMHWVWQTESYLSVSNPMDFSATGYIEYAWATWEQMI